MSLSIREFLTLVAVGMLSSPTSAADYAVSVHSQFTTNDMCLTKSSPVYVQADPSNTACASGTSAAAANCTLNEGVYQSRYCVDSLSQFKESLGVGKYITVNIFGIDNNVCSTATPPEVILYILKDGQCHVTDQGSYKASSTKGSALWQAYSSNDCSGTAVTYTSQHATDCAFITGDDGTKVYYTISASPSVYASITLTILVALLTTLYSL